MGMDEIAVTVGGVTLIGLIYWFFFMKREEIAAASRFVRITVDGGYTPQTLKAEVGKEITLTFIRKDPSPCLEEVILSDFGVRRYLPLNEEVEIKIRPTEKRDYSFSCGMNMFRGKIIST